MNKDKQIRELKIEIIIMFVTIILFAGLLIWVAEKYGDKVEELQSCQEKVHNLTKGYLGECVVSPQGVLFNVTREGCEEHIKIHERKDWVKFCIGEYCEVIE